MLHGDIVRMHKTHEVNWNTGTTTTPRFASTFSIETGPAALKTAASQYQFYRIRGIRFTCWNSKNRFTQSEIQRVVSVIDRNDATLPGEKEFDTLRQGIGSRVHLNDCRPWKRYWKPNILAPLTSGASGVSAVPKYDQWISTAHLDIAHYGIKVSYEGAINVARSNELRITYYVEFKNPMPQA